ncbi:MAG: aminotransferase class V-fold PLP-dependent enzyme, partial [Firmicutes bacterium]|nr:aminotransferase class V-fold PLP-dependent enzyme [Bacillota bacterium]
MKRVYLDHAATTPVRPEVVELMVEYMTSRFGNPSSLHMEGREAKDALEEARRRVATLINASPEEICFTSGGTEADNMAIKGAVLAAGGRGHIITTKIEHHAVLHCAQALGETGCEVTYLDVDGDGLVDPDDVRRAIRKNTLLVSVMLANNEVGTIQPISEIAAICKEHGVLLHTDAVQVPGQIPVDVPALGADM